MDRPIPSLRVQIGSEIVLRRAEPHVLECDELTSRATVVHLRPQLRPGEILVERMGDIPLIVVDESLIFPTPTAETMGFDTWMKQRTDLAHAEFMRRTSRLLWCDWRAATTPAEIARIYGIRAGEVKP
ncbi:hypothetical protein QPK31_24930 [Massilia sp. YIM B02769]|uniref:hypothetical protein n=1 Tax=Massilia sp. YIM B02769 TaxID=3050129 RepID=UPI0025B6C439|nr:hypothetical protein [Massilia sp. YIM B02769]MDN4061471.1 hypothetical protein [Massilia sp. YIM B02769]